MGKFSLPGIGGKTQNELIIVEFAGEGMQKKKKTGLKFCIAKGGFCCMEPLNGGWQPDRLHLKGNVCQPKQYQ